MYFEVPLVLVTACILVSLIWPGQRMPLYIGFFIGFLSVIWPLFREYLTWAWHKLAEILGAATSRIILGVFFFLILVPLAFIFRIFHTDALNLRKKKKSLFVERYHTYAPDDLIHPW